MGSTKRIICYRGLPGSGKSTDALAYVDVDTTSRCRVNRDTARTMLHGRRLGHGRQEALVTEIQMNAIRAAFALGYNEVVVDDTNLPDSSVNRFEKLAVELGARFSVKDFRDVDLEVCIARDRLRAIRRVGENAIRKMHADYIAHRSPAARLRSARI